MRNDRDPRLIFAWLGAFLCPTRQGRAQRLKVQLHRMLVLRYSVSEMHR